MLFRYAVIPRQSRSGLLVGIIFLNALITPGFTYSRSQPVLEINPAHKYSADAVVRIVGLHNYARLVGPVQLAVRATDDSGISRIELFLDANLLGTYNVGSVLTTISVPFTWNSAAVANGKHILSAKAFNSNGLERSTALVVVCHNYSISQPTGSVIVLNPSSRFQTMTGWEATAEAGQLYSSAWNIYKDSLLDRAVNDLGINRVRLEIKSGVENPTDYFAQWRAGQIDEAEYNAKRYEIINDNSDPNVINPNGFKWSSLDSTIDALVIPLRQRLAAKGETLWVNVNYVDFGSSAFEHKANPSEYAEFVLATYQHIQSRYGFVPNSWEISLEPDTASAGWSSVQVAQSIKAAGDRLLANGFVPNFVAPSTTDAANAPGYIDQIAQTAGAMQYVGQFSYHRYAGGTSAVLQQIASRGATYGKATGMLEWIGADYNTLHQDIKVGQNSSWQQFCLAGPLDWGPDSGDRYFIVDDTNAETPIVTMGSRTKLLRQYFKFIRIGAQRIEALTGNTNFDPVAFINPNGRYVAIVKAATSGTFMIKGLPAGSYGIKYTTASQYDIDLSDVSVVSGQAISLSIPTAGVVSVFAR